MQHSEIDIGELAGKFIEQEVQVFMDVSNGFTQSIKLVVNAAVNGNSPARFSLVKVVSKVFHIDSLSSPACCY